MGQRHMTYIYVYDEKGTEAVGALYNQWNHALIQPHKIIRFEKQLAKWKKNDVHFPYNYNRWPELYEQIAAISDWTTGCKFYNELPNYEGNYGMYCEDNNDGWQFVVIKVDSEQKCKPVQITYGFKPEHDSRFMNLYDNLMNDDARKSVEYIKETVENILNEFTKTEQKILKRINDSFDLEVLKRAEMRIKYHISKKCLEKTG